MSNKLNTDRTLKNFLNKKRVITTKIANNSVNFFQGEVFDTEGAAIGKRWDKSERAKQRGKTLVKTGRGKRSIKAKVLSDTKATITPEAEYMRFHHTGAGPQPVRQIMGNSDKLLKQNNDIINREMSKI